MTYKIHIEILGELDKRLEAKSDPRTPARQAADKFLDRWYGHTMTAAEAYHRFLHEAGEE